MHLPHIRGETRFSGKPVSTVKANRIYKSPASLKFGTQERWSGAKQILCPEDSKALLAAGEWMKFSTAASATQKIPHTMDAPFSTPSNTTHELET
jgi:hypothetical protein